jgi:hypothetical protein
MMEFYVEEIRKAREMYTAKEAFESCTKIKNNIFNNNRFVSPEEREQVYTFLLLEEELKQLSEQILLHQKDNPDALDPNTLDPLLWEEAWIQTRQSLLQDTYHIVNHRINGLVHRLSFVLFK